MELIDSAFDLILYPLETILWVVVWWYCQQSLHAHVPGINVELSLAVGFSRSCCSKSERASWWERERTLGNDRERGLLENRNGGGGREIGSN